MRRRLVAGSIFAVVAVAVVFLLVFKPAPKPKRLPIKTLDPWILQSNDPKAVIGFKDTEAYAIYLGNGSIGVRIGSDGTGRDSACYMSGLYQGEEFLALPNWADFAIYDAQGKRFELDADAPYRQTLNMREGYVETELTLKSGKQRLTGKITAFILRPEAKLDEANYPMEGGIAALRYDLKPNFDGRIEVREQLKPGPEWKQVRTLKNQSSVYFNAVGPDESVVTINTMVEDSDGKIIDSPIAVRSNEDLTLVKTVCVSWTKESYKSDTSTEQKLMDSIRGSYDKLFAAHKKAWRDLWESDIVIEGDPKAQQAVHAMMFYLISSASNKWSIPPTGLCAGPWRGHIFWDADIWMFPALLLQHPDLAEGIVNYRLQVMSGARENAKKRGLSGVEFAWESARTGLETIGAPFCDERHVTSDAAFAAATYAMVTGKDTLSCKENSIQTLLRETAEYWASRVTYNKELDRYEILNVLPPDEDANNNNIINNSVYTDVAAKMNLELAIQWAKKNNSSYPAKWEEIAQKMYIPFDPAAKRFIEYDGYKDQKTKQADVELLIYPLMYPMTDEVKVNTFDFYKTKTNPLGPAMTESIHSVIAAELGRQDEAYKYFTASYEEFLRGPFLLFNEKRSKTYENMCFVTACGGTLQSVIYGFGGLRIGRNPGGFEEALPGLYIKPCLPEKWKKLEIRNVKWNGKAYDFTVLPGNEWKISPHN